MTDHEVVRCELCGEPMPPGEQMFKFHGYSGDCPKPPLPRPQKRTYEELEAALTAAESRARLAEEDAERYRWLRGNGAIISREVGIPVHKADFGIGLDAAIDQARKDKSHD